MGKFCLGLAILIPGIFLTGEAGIAGLRLSVQPLVATCSANTEIPEDVRTTLHQTGLRFVNTILSAAPDAAYAALTSEAKLAAPFDQFAALIHQVIQPAGPFNNLHVTQTYLIRLASGGQEQRVLCGNLARREEVVSVAAKPVPEQSHLLIEGETRNNNWAFLLWLIPEQDWRVQYFHFNVTAMVGKSAQDIWNLGRDEHRRNHNFNAAVLYEAASELAYRGPNFQLGIVQQIQSDRAKLTLPAEIQGRPPFTWQFGDRNFKILRVGPIGVGGKIYLYITQEIAPWSADQEADHENRELIREFDRVFPEYTDAFAGLVVAAHERGGTRGYRTIDTSGPAPK